MERCTSCGSELPVAAQFCGYCGRVVEQPPNSMSGYLIGDVHADDTPTSISGAAHPVLSSGEHEYSTVRHTWSKGEMTHNMSVADEEAEEEEERRRRALLGLPLLGALASGQPPASGLPMVQGTPQLSGVPLVQGIPGGAPTAQAIQGAASPAPTPFAPAPSTPPPSTPMSHPGSWPPAHSSTPPPGSSSSPGHTGTGTGSGSRPGTSGGSCALTALIIVVVCLIIIGTIGGLFFGVSPALTLIGSSKVMAGEGLHLHGMHFFPGSGVTLTLDDRLQLFAAGPGAASEAHITPPAVLQMTAARQFASLNTAIKADAGGSFDITIPVDASWGLGAHTIRATEAISSRSAVLNFTVDMPAAKLDVNPTTLDFGKLEMGTKAILSVVLNNSGGQSLSWQAGTDATWLKLLPDAGTLQPGAAPQFIYVTGDTSHLKVGSYSATLHVTSKAGNAQISVTLEVVPQSPKPQAKISVAPTALNFGTLDIGKQSTQAVIVSNSGNLALNWKADTGGAGWVTLDTSSQTISPGGFPDAINVTVDTTKLRAGNQSATLTISSNGGTAQVVITLVVNQPVQPPPTQPCTLLAPSSSNATFAANYGSNPKMQTFTIAVSGACSAGVTITPTVTTTSGTGWLAVAPSSETITGGIATFSVNVTSSALVPGSYAGSIALAAAIGNTTINGSPQTVGVTLIVTEVPPVLAVSPSTLSFNLTNGDGSTTQGFNISNTGGAPLKWNATLGADVQSFVTLSFGTDTNLNAGATTGVNVNVNPYNQKPGDYPVTVTVTAIDPLTGQSVQGSPATVSVTINITAQPSMQLSTQTLTLAPPNCQYATSGTVTLTNAGGGTLSWSVADPVYTSGQPTGWLSVKPSGQGSGDTTLTFSADGSGSQVKLGVTYTATVTITPSIGNPQTVTVNFTISCLQ